MSFLSNLNWRYATKKFDGRIVSEDDLNTIVEAIRLSPSANGAQPYHIVVASGEAKNKLIESSGQIDKLGCSHLFIFCARTDYPDRAKKQVENTASIEGVPAESLERLSKSLERISGKTQSELKEWSARQTYIALGFGLSACAELSIDACPMEGFKPAEFKELLKLPDFMNPVVIMAVGYRDPSDHTQPPKRPKIRFPKDELFDFKEML